MSDYAAKGLIEPVEPYLREAGIDPASFTDASRAGGDDRAGASTACRGTRMAACSTSIWRLFDKAGLMRGDQPILPQSADELLATRASSRRAPASPI